MKLGANGVMTMLGENLQELRTRDMSGARWGLSKSGFIKLHREVLEIETMGRPDVITKIKCKSSLIQTNDDLHFIPKDEPP